MSDADVIISAPHRGREEDNMHDVGVAGCRAAQFVRWMRLTRARLGLAPVVGLSSDAWCGWCSTAC